MFNATWQVIWFPQFKYTRLPRINAADFLSNKRFSVRMIMRCSWVNHSGHKNSYTLAKETCNMRETSKKKKISVAFDCARRVDSPKKGQCCANWQVGQLIHVFLLFFNARPHASWKKLDDLRRKVYRNFSVIWLCYHFYLEAVVICMRNDF